MLWVDDVVLTAVDGVTRLVGGQHQLVQLLTGADPDDLLFAVGCDRFGDVHDAGRWDLGDEDFASDRCLEGMKHQVNGLMERDPKPRHSGVGDGNLAARCQAAKKRDDRTSRADDVSVANNAQLRPRMGGVCVALHDDLFLAELGRPIEVDGVDGLVSGQRNDGLDGTVDGGVDYVLGSEDVGADRFEGVVLRCGHLFESRRVNHDVGALYRTAQAIGVTDIAEEEAKLL